MRPVGRQSAQSRVLRKLGQQKAVQHLPAERHQGLAMDAHQRRVCPPRLGRQDHAGLQRRRGDLQENPGAKGREQGPAGLDSGGRQGDGLEAVL